MFIKWPSCFCALWLCRRLTMGPALGASQEISLVKACGGPPPASRQMAPLVLTHMAQQPLRSRLSQGSRIYSRKQVTACCRRTCTQSWQWQRHRYQQVLVTYLRHSLASDAFTCGLGLLYTHCYPVCSDMLMVPHGTFVLLPQHAQQKLLHRWQCCGTKTSVC